MTDQTTVSDDPDLLPGTPEERAAESAHGMSAIAPEELPMLPGEVRPHPSPFQYVMIAVILCMITGFEVGTYYLPKDFPRPLYVTILLTLAVTKFVTVVAWYMHLRVDRPIFRRFFVVGGIGALTLYTIVLATLHVFE
ncbi:MAG: cytochrome C oxidase subunit IV family protein [Acidimicrobiia bacterium]